MSVPVLTAIVGGHTTNQTPTQELFKQANDTLLKLYFGDLIDRVTDETHGEAIREVLGGILNDPIYFNVTQELVTSGSVKFTLNEKLYDLRISAGGYGIICEGKYRKLDSPAKALGIAKNLYTKYGSSVASETIRGIVEELTESGGGLGAIGRQLSEPERHALIKTAYALELAAVLIDPSYRRNPGSQSPLAHRNGKTH